MTNAYLNRENQCINVTCRPQVTLIQGPKRTSNRNFLDEFHKVYYNKESGSPLR